VPVATVVIDPTTLLVHIDAPLGATEPPLTLPLRRWWCALPDPGAELTFARLVAHLGHRLAPPVTAADDERISEALAALVRIAERLPPERIGFEAEDLRHRLARSAPARPSRSAGPA
jgi:hypothetical protein